MAGNAFDLFCFFVFILTYKKLFEKLLGQLKPRQHVNPGLPEKTGWLRAWLLLQCTCHTNTRTGKDGVVLEHC